MAYDIHNYSVVVHHKKNRARYPIRQLQIGQSFWVPNAEEKELRAAAAYVNSRFHKWGIHVSVVRDNKDTGFWCGRVDVPTERVVYRPIDGQ